MGAVASSLRFPLRARRSSGSRDSRRESYRCCRQTRQSRHRYRRNHRHHRQQKVPHDQQQHQRWKSFLPLQGVHRYQNHLHRREPYALGSGCSFFIGAVIVATAITSSEARIAFTGNIIAVSAVCRGCSNIIGSAASVSRRFSIVRASIACRFVISIDRSISVTCRCLSFHCSRVTIHGRSIHISRANILSAADIARRCIRIIGFSDSRFIVRMLYNRRSTARQKRYLR